MYNPQMVRTSKQTEVTQASPVTQAPVETAPVVKSRASKKETVAPVVVVPVTLDVVPVVLETVALESSATVKVHEFGTKLQQMASLFASMKTDFKTLEKVFSRELKIAQKNSKKRKSSGNRAPSGFVKPTRISDELANFLGKTVGTEMARTEVSKEINAYIREKGLQDKQNGRRIHPDASLAKLLALTAADELTYFNLQRYMKHHFIKPEVVAAASA
jgi:fumarylacetoacetate (FAA) hydrolase family protein